MAIEIRANVTREVYPNVREICGGGLPETYDGWKYECQKASSGTRDLNPKPAVMIEVDLNELREFVRKTSDKGQTALDNYAFEKARREGFK